MDKITTIKERILFYLEEKNIRKESFYRETGMSASNFKGSGLKSDLGIDKVVKVLTVYPELNNHLHWLIKGEGVLDLNAPEEHTTEKKDSQSGNLLYQGFNEEIGDLLANIFAQYNTQDKSLLFIQNQISKMEKKMEAAIVKQNKNIERLLSLTQDKVDLK
ncbi:hypothetical protein CEY12_15030 [Chryseobacterium sp. T16E-39]|uniref:hypothetical protein n=1 Tax=Chryseobacterium sp. T16E-39 TaxID=2015076 RepID=UPI000B5B1E5F|nr:hypothetical protein [Chryseobacterium sp. T16E-39]ASK31337.1 hypothetical protein CEY12_15030 [Chryseobacterium sp. T16E-39]